MKNLQDTDTSNEMSNRREECHDHSSLATTDLRHGIASSDKRLVWIETDNLEDGLESHIHTTTTKSQDPQGQQPHQQIEIGHSSLKTLIKRESNEKKGVRVS